MIQVISSCSELMNFFKDFTKDNYIFFGNKHCNLIIDLVNKSIDEILTRIENIVPSTVTVVPKENNATRFNYAFYLDLITRYPKTAILFDITSSNGIITSIEMKDKFKEKTTKILEYIFRKYNMDSDLSTIQSMNTTEVLNLPLRDFFKDDKGKEPAVDVMNIDSSPPRNGILKNSLNGSHYTPSSSSSSLNLKTFLNTQANAANSAKNFPNRSLYREYKVIESNIEEWTKNTVNNLASSNNVVSFQTPYAISFSNSSSDKANDPATFQRIFNVKKPIFSGKIEEADDFVHQFYEFLHFFAHPPNEESLASAFISCLPPYQQSYFLKTYLPARGVNPNRRRRMNEINESIINTSNFYDVSLHNILEEIANENESELLNMQRDLHRNEVTITNEKTISNNNYLISKLLPKELMEYKDVFNVPRGLPPSRGQWDFKLNITSQDLKNLPLAKSKLVSKEASRATKEMIKNYMEEGWIQPAVLPHAVNMFPVPKHDGSFRYVYNYVPVNKICDIAQNSIPNLREQVNELCKHKYIICLDLRSAYN